MAWEHFARIVTLVGTFVRYNCATGRQLTSNRANSKHSAMHHAGCLKALAWIGKGHLRGLGQPAKADFEVYKEQQA